tara:strand:- start:292 stop:444 length:153 start_codon:yes stop_codon:yes gene_type:complete
MIEFFSMGKYTVFVYAAYLVSIVFLLAGYLLPHYELKKEIRQKEYEDNKK